MKSNKNVKSSKKGELDLIDDLIEELGRRIGCATEVCKLSTRDVIEIQKILLYIQEHHQTEEIKPPQVWMKYTCPNCGIVLDPSILVETDSEKAIEIDPEDLEDTIYSYCPRCGQRIEWERGSIC